MAAGAVGQGCTEEATARIENRADLDVCEAPAVEVELVGLGDQLHGSGAVPTRPVVDRQGHLQVLEEARQVGALEVARHHPLETTPVHLRPLAVLGGRRAAREQARDFVKEGGQVVVVLREPHAPHVGQREGDLR